MVILCRFLLEFRHGRHMKPSISKSLIGDQRVAAAVAGLIPNILSICAAGTYPGRRWPLSKKIAGVPFTPSFSPRAWTSAIGWGHVFIAIGLPAIPSSTALVRFG